MENIWVHNHVRWVDKAFESVIDFMVHSKWMAVFVKLGHALNNIKDHKYIYKLLNSAIKEVEQENAV